MVWRLAASRPILTGYFEKGHEMNEIRQFYLRGTLTGEHNQKPQPEGFYQRMAAEIVVGAIMDWRALIYKKAWLDVAQCNRNFNELRLFFKSDWCAFLLQGFEMQPEKILEMLEAELRAAMENDEKRRKSKMKRSSR